MVQANSGVNDAFVENKIWKTLNIAQPNLLRVSD